MIDKKSLGTLCRPVAIGEPLLRPFVCRGPLKKGGAFMVGVNPATNIIEADAGGFERYVDALTDINSFLKVYDKARAREGKHERSPTRNGLDTASSWLATRGFQTVLDTNISPYPCSSLELWKRLSSKQKSMGVFREVIKYFQPSLVLLHGKDAYEEFTATYAPELARPELFSQVVLRPRLGVVKWPDGTTAEVYVSKHLRFFKGAEGGKYFAPLRTALSG